MDDAWLAREEGLEAASSKSLRLAMAVGAGNAGLMWILAIHPFSAATMQLMAGACAMALHGWGGWEIAKVLFAWSKASADLREEAAEIFKAQAISSKSTPR